MVKLTAKLIEDAKAGNPNKLRELGTAVEGSSYSLAVLDACMVHLPAERLDQPLCDIENPGILDLRRAAIACLYRALRTCAMGLLMKINQEAKQATKVITVERLVENFEGVTTWIDLVISIPLRDDCATTEMLADAAGVLHAMARIDEKLLSLILYSSNVINLGLKLWCGILRKNDDSILDISDEDGAPTVELMRALLETAPEIIHDAILSSSKAIQRKISVAVTARFTHLSMWGSTFQFSEYTTSIYVRSLRDVTALLASSPGVEAQMQKQRYLYLWAKTAVDLHRRLKGRLRHVMVAFVSSLLYTTHGSGRNPITGLYDILGTDIFTVVFDLFRTEPRPSSFKEEEREGGVLLWNEYLSYAYYPRTLDAFREAGLTFPQPQIDRILTKVHLKPDWCRWMAVVNQGYRILNCIDCTPPPHDRHCDNLKHLPLPEDGSYTEELKEYPVKACSGCHSVLYCGVDCQEEDWQTRHHRECKLMRYSRFSRRERKVRYTAPMRFFHAAVITEILNKTPPEVLFAESRRRWPGKATTEFITACNFSGGKSGPGSRLVVPLDIYYSKMSANVGDCPAMNQRADEMVAAFQAESDSGTVALTEATFSWASDIIVFMMSEHHYDESVKRWQLNRCIVRFGDGNRHPE
ncbi:hypothetical protein BKA70DRAFT_1198275 [Coprinopsis sp. MPI-PUGE-AT-0042]|nr:hypothetical protein BKA70DRAFT_1198275 [Coprinopsis sp. MPI-PUGE-AT-0042]